MIATRKILQASVEEVARLVQQLDYVIYPELQALLQDRVDTIGDGTAAMMLSSPGAANIVLWQPASEPSGGFSG